MLSYAWIISSFGQIGQRELASADKFTKTKKTHGIRRIYVDAKTPRVPSETALYSSNVAMRCSKCSAATWSNTTPLSAGEKSSCARLLCSLGQVDIPYQIRHKYKDRCSVHIHIRMDLIFSARWVYQVQQYDVPGIPLVCAGM